MTNETTDRTHYINDVYAELLEELREWANPMTTIDGDALTLDFAFDDRHSWTRAEPLMAELNKKDQALLEAEMRGGRLPRPEAVLPTLSALAAIPGLVANQSRWTRMTEVADELTVEEDEDYSLQTFAELFEEVLLELHPEGEDPDKSWVEIVKHPAAEAPGPGTADWVRLNFEFFLTFATAPVDRVSLSYPGHGYTAELTLTSGDSVRRFSIIVPASSGVVELVAHHHEYHDPTNRVPVMDVLNAMPDADIEALCTIAARDDVIFDNSICEVFTSRRL